VSRQFFGTIGDFGLWILEHPSPKVVSECSCTEEEFRLWDRAMCSSELDLEWTRMCRCRVFKSMHGIEPGEKRWGSWHLDCVRIVNHLVLGYMNKPDNAELEGLIGVT
jgi:hypothetical protein